ncbi:hypothetical protein BCR34DRAFT_206513 [Clohesyomyces aquaticus]|uniref:Uncharacterized protein n=1 Tax=Clohesyomyces aquaticus TaxID=1231657 RepID=A0A1Y2A9A7_9PLEO|nr:hypothetical protein BCR34DRAFT_206513 [Clohesyomyces aquaticus]
MATLTRPRTRQRSYLHRLWTRELRAPTHEPCTEQDTSASPDSASRITNANDPDRQAPNLNDATSGRLRRYLGGNIPGRRRLQSTQGRSANDFDLAPQNAERTGALRETSPSRYSLEGPRLSNGVPLNPDPAPTPDPTIPPAPVPIQQQEEALGEPSPDRSSLPGPGPSNGAVLNPDSAPTAEPTILPVPNLIQPQEEANLPPTGMQASNPRETISSLPTDTSNPAESRMNHDTEAILVSGGRVGHKERLTAPREVSAAFIASMDTYCVRVSNARRSSGVYWLHWRTYVGKLKENPPPVCMDEEWCTLREILVQDLGPVIESLFSSLGDTKAACIEPELCMTGKLRYYLNTVDLRPTIWIRCGSEMCQKKVEEATQDLDYLKPFRKKGRVQVQLKAPRLSARFQSVSGAISGPSATVPFGFHVSVLIPDTVSYHVPSACGMRIKCRSVDGLATEQVWIVGGLIRIDSTIYGLTAAHPIFDGITHEAEPHGARLMSEDTRTQSEGSTQTPTRPHESEEGNWHTATVHSVNYGGRISLPGVTPQTMHANCSDYALVRLDARAEVLPNSYESPENSQEGACIVDSISSDPACGEVLILCSPGDVRSGYLLGLPALFMTHMGVFHTRKIQTEAPFGESLFLLLFRQRIIEGCSNF